MGMYFEMITLRPTELTALLASPDTIIRLAEEAGRERLGLDKRWHGLQFLLTQTAWEGEPPFNFIVGGEEVGDVDMGYGSAKYFGSAEVQELADALDALSSDELRKRFDPALMTALRIYPGVWGRDAGEDDALGRLVDSFETLKRHVRRVADRGDALVTYIS